MSKQPVNEDRNFDDLAQRFQKNIYGGLKGEIRLAVLERDFRQHFPALPFGGSASAKPLRILDAGGGQGQFSLQFARAGHELVVCDISAEMLNLARQQIESEQLQNRVELVHCAIQDLPTFVSDTSFDLVLCHAVMEWVVNPKELLDCLTAYVKSAGFLSLTFYNLHSLIYKNLLRTNFKKVQARDFAGARGSLTPINPLYPAQVYEWISSLPFQVLTTSGIRVFHDYIFNEAQRERDPQSLIEMELAFSQQQPYRELGRYLHLLAAKA